MNGPLAETARLPMSAAVIDETLILSCEFYEELISWNDVFRIVDVLTLFGICFWPAIG